MTDEETFSTTEQISRFAVIERNAWLRGEPGFRVELEAFLNTIEKRGSMKQQPLVEGEYRVFVDYTMPHDKETLEAEFSGGVDNLFYDNHKWKKHSSCVGIDETPGDRVMVVKHFDRETESEANIGEMHKLGYRPATHLEAYAFAKVNHTEPPWDFWIYALGSHVMYGHRYDVAGVWPHDGRCPGLSYDRFCCRWSVHTRFLFVRL